MLHIRKALFIAAALAAFSAVAATTAPPAQNPQVQAAPRAESEAIPYLQNPRADGMTVCLLASAKDDGVSITWGEGHTTQETAAQKTEISGTPWAVWKCRLRGLAPGSAYTYLIHYTHEGVRCETEPHHFTTLDPKAEAVRFIAFNDIHNNDGLVSSAMKFVAPGDFQFSLLLGDIWTDPSRAGGAKEIFRLWRALVKVLDGAEKPVLIVRGNHETRGNFSERMAGLFDLPDLAPEASFFEQKWNWAFRAGPVWLLALDGGDDFIKREASFRPLREGQAKWTTEQLRQNTAASAPWKMLLTHMPLYNDNIWTSEPCRIAWEPVLKDAGITLEICGHDHQWKSIAAGKTSHIRFDGHYPDQQDPLKRQEYSLTPLFPVLVGGGPHLKKDSEEGTVMKVSATKEKLEVRLISIVDGRER